MLARPKGWFYGRSLPDIAGSNRDGVFCQSYVLSDRVLCIELIILPEETYRVLSV